MGLRRRKNKKGGEGGYIRIQNLSSQNVKVKVKEGRNVDDMGMDEIQGTLKPDTQFPKKGKSPFEDDDDDPAVYQYIEGDVKNRFQKDGYFGLEVHPSDGGAQSSIQLCVDHNSWDWKDDTPDKDSPVQIMADVDEEDDVWKIEIRIYDNYDTKCWMANYADHIASKPLNQVGLPGTHDSGTYKFSKDMGASPDSDLTSTLQDKLDRGRLLGKLNDAILKQIFERMCQCQTKSIKQQLEAGIRYLDLRVARHAESGEFWTCHGVYCVNIVEIMKDIKKFMDKNPKEIVMLDFNHLYEMGDIEHHKELLDIIFGTLGDKVADRMEYRLSNKSKVEDFWEHNVQAIVFYQKHGDVKEFYGGKTWPMWMRKSKWPNTGETEVLHDRLAEQVEGREEDKFFILQGILTPSGDVIKKKILDPDGISIKSFAVRCNPKVVEWCEDEWKEQNLNIFIVDFYENCSMIPSVINYNRTKG